MTVIERFEGQIAVLEEIESGKHEQVDRALFPANAREGDVVEYSTQSGKYTVNAESTAERRSKVVNRLRRMGL